MQKELLSAYMDGEEVSAELTEQLCQDKDSQESWAAYHEKSCKSVAASKRIKISFLSLVSWSKCAL
jgi:hypothetical protein